MALFVNQVETLVTPGLAENEQAGLANCLASAADTVGQTRDLLKAIGGGALELAYEFLGLQQVEDVRLGFVLQDTLVATIDGVHGLFVDPLALVQDGGILADGAMGTMLHARGISFNVCFDDLNLSQPTLVSEIHRAYLDAGAQIIEPIMKVDVYTPEDHVGDVIGDLNRRRGMIKSQEPGVTGVRIKADCPLSEMFGYIGDLRTMTSGRGQFSMEFSHYLPCPKNVAEEVIKMAAERNAKK